MINALAFLDSSNHKLTDRLQQSKLGRGREGSCGQQPWRSRSTWARLNQERVLYSMHSARGTPPRPREALEEGLHRWAELQLVHRRTRLEIRFPIGVGIKPQRYAPLDPGGVALTGDGSETQTSRSSRRPEAPALPPSGTLFPPRPAYRAGALHAGSRPAPESLGRRGLGNPALTRFRPLARRASGI